ncbi:hypothetical protein FQN60_000375, partial [Etheostoma spectabile]
MATFFGEVLSVYSRAVEEDEEELDEDEEDGEIRRELEEKSCCGMLRGSVFTGFLSVYVLTSENWAAVGHASVWNERSRAGTGITSEEETACAFYRHKDNPSVLICQATCYIAEDQLFQWTEKVFNCLQHRDLNVTVLSDSSVAEYKTADYLCYSSAPFLRSLHTGAFSGQSVCQSLEQPNIVTGLPAAVLNQCEVHRIAAVVYQCYSDVTGPDSVTMETYKPALTKLSKSIQFDPSPSTDVLRKFVRTTNIQNGGDNAPVSCLSNAGSKKKTKLTRLTLPMSTNRVITSTSGRCKASVRRNKEHPVPGGANKVLAQRNHAVVAVGAWVESGQDFVEHPSAMALLTEEIQTERRRETEESLRRFQDEVRHRVAQQAQGSKKRQQPQTDSMIKADRRIPHQQDHVWTQHVSAGERLMTAEDAVQRGVTESRPQESSGGMRQVRLRLAACRMIPHGEMSSDLPGGKWNISSNRHKPGSHMLRAEQEVEEEAVEEEEEEEEEEGDHHLFTSQHKCPLVQQKGSAPVLWDSDKSQPDPGLKNNLRAPPVLWPLTDQEELKRQRQSQFLVHRRLYMNIEREQVKENKQNRKHLKRTARFIEALRAQMKERLSQERLEPPPLCCCASSFWDSHPNTCANNCVFHNNPKAYAKALHSTMLSFEL